MNEKAVGLCLALLLMLGAVSVAEASFPFKIGLVTGTVSQGEEEYRAGEQMVAKYGDRIIHVTYPDNFMQEQETGLILLQNIGTLSTYNSHEQVGMFAIAALLIGGGTVSKATIVQALLGMFLFHTLFVVSPTAGQTLFGSAQVGEYFRVFVAYGIIAISLALHAWQKKSIAQVSFDADVEAGNGGLELEEPA